MKLRTLILASMALVILSCILDIVLMTRRSPEAEAEPITSVQEGPTGPVIIVLPPEDKPKENNEE